MTGSLPKPRVGILPVVLAAVAAAVLAGQPEALASVPNIEVVTAAADAPTVVAVRVENGPRAANWRSDPVWAQAQVMDGFVQREPVEGAPASERTQVRVVFDAEALYIGAWLYDSEAQRIIVGERRRDASLSNSDAFLVVLDTFHDQQNGFVFGTNPSGIEYDGQVVGQGGSAGGGGGGRGRQQGGAGAGFNLNWDGSWSVSTEIDEAGWYALIRIPFSTLRYGPAEVQTWGINFARYVGRKNEQVFWAPIPRQYDLFRLSNAGVLANLELPAQRVVTVAPYALASSQRIPALHEGVRYPLEVGGDAKFGVTGSLTLDLTVNTDFAQVEVDEQQLDLTRFSLFFPEKRPFFLENAGRFAVGSNRSAQMFFSRRIGISGSGAPVPIQWGTRLSGRSGGLDVGLLHIETGGAEGIEAANAYSVARLARELPNRSSLGAMVTNRAAVNVSGDYGRTYALDASLGVGESFDVTTVLGATQAPAYADSREAIVITSQFRNRTWRITNFYDQIGANFNPEVGYLRRSAFRQAGGTIAYSLRTPGISWLRELRPHVNYEASYSLDGFKETQTLHTDIAIAWENGAQFTPEPNWVYDGLQHPFQIAPGIEVQPGAYSGWLFTPRLTTSTQRAVVFSTTAVVGSFLSGSRKGGTASLRFQRGGTFAGEANVEQARINLREGSFTTTLGRGRLGYSFSPNLFVQSLIQYSSQTRIWSGNVRLGWIDTAGTGVFLVYNERQRENGFADPLERTFIVKLSRQLDVGRLGRDRFGW